MDQVLDAPAAAVVVDPVTAYARDVVEGRIVAGKPVRLACQRHLNDLEHAAERGYTWCPELVARVVQFFSALRLADGEHAGQPFRLRAWQTFVVGSIVGWLDEVGARRFQSAYIEIGKGNGKTPLAAGLAWYGLIADGEPGAEIYFAAVSRDQAGIAFRDAVRFREASPALMAATVQHAANVSFPALGGYMRPVSSEGRGLDGKRVHMAMVDELHEHSSGIVVDKMSAGTKGRRQPLIFEITNSGYDRNSVCWAHHQYSLQVLEGVVQNDAWFAYVCALDEGDDWMKDESVWLKANPNLGVSIPVEYLRKQVAEARDMPYRQNIVARLNFCVWTEQATRWLAMDRWDRCAELVDLEQMRGRRCFGGLDLSTVNDLSALAWVFPPESEGERWKVALRFWVPAENLRRRVQRDRVPYDVWARDGLIEVTEGNVVDYQVIRARVLEDAERFQVAELAFDRWNSSMLVRELQDEGLPMVAFGQGYASMSAPCRMLEKLVEGGDLAHGGHPVLRWMAANCAVAQDPAGNVKPDKAKSTERIDGIVATLMGLGRAIAGEPEPEPFIEAIG